MILHYYYYHFSQCRSIILKLECDYVIVHYLIHPVCFDKIYIKIVINEFFCSQVLMHQKIKKGLDKVILENETHLWLIPTLIWGLTYWHTSRRKLRHGLRP